MSFANEEVFPSNTPLSNGAPMVEELPTSTGRSFLSGESPVVEALGPDSELFRKFDGKYPDPPPMQSLDGSDSPRSTSPLSTETRDIALPDRESFNDGNLPSERKPNDPFSKNIAVFESTEAVPEYQDEKIEDETNDESDEDKEERGLFLQSARNAVQLQRNDLAAKRFTEYLRRYPNDGIARSEFAGLLSSLGPTKLAAVHLEHLRAQFPGSLESLRLYADIHLQLKDYARAEDALNQLLVHREYQAVSYTHLTLPTKA